MGVKYKAYMKCSKCGGVAFYFEHMPIRSDAVISNGVFEVDGTPVISGTEIQCTSCNTYKLDVHYDNIMEIEHDGKHS